MLTDEPLVYKPRLVSLNSIGFSFSVLELGCLLARAAAASKSFSNTAQLSINFPFLEGAFAYAGCLILKKRLFWYGFASLSV